MARFEPNAHEEIAKISQELSFFDIKLLPPDLNLSDFDFKIEGKNIRYGLNSIKGVSGKVIESLIDFRESRFENKYDVFIAAKDCGVNIGTMSAFIQAGLLDSFVSSDRCRLVLEAQTFNILTDREKRNIIELGPKFNYDVLNTIHDCKSNDTPADDGRVLFADRRFNTFKKKYDPYRNIYRISQGIPLTEEDRKPWLDALRKLLEELLEKYESAVVACSVLRQSYRKYLLRGTQGIRLVYLKGDCELIKKRLKERRGHFASPDILQSQFEVLEEPHDALDVSVSKKPECIVKAIIEGLSLEEG